MFFIFLVFNLGLFLSINLYLEGGILGEIKVFFGLEEKLGELVNI